MISSRIIAVGIAALSMACAHRIPPLSEVQDQAPIRWPLRPLGPLPDQVRVEPLELALSTGGEITVRPADGPLIHYRDSRRFLAGTSLDRGYAKRFAWLEPEGIGKRSAQRAERAETGAGASPERAPQIERYVEVFRGSPIISIFQRVRLVPGKQALPEHSFELGDQLTEMISFDGHSRTIGPLRTIRLDPRRTMKPFVIMRAPDDTEGVLFFFPHRPEIRRWFLEDYVVTSSLAAEIEASGASLTIRFPSVDAPAAPRMSFDFPMYVMPYDGTAEAALEQFRIGKGEINYWHPRPAARELRMLRYFPAEFVSWIDSTEYAYGHPGGYAWGNMTLSMKGMRTDPLDDRALLRDQAFRMLTFFVEAGRDKGAPPNLMMHPQWTNQMQDPKEIRTVVFCQYWEFRLEEFGRLFDSPHLLDEEKAEIYRSLQAAKRVFDPDRGGFAKRTPNGGVWFDYFDLPISASLDWIINTHATNVANAGEFARLARKMRQEEDYGWWRQLFLAGLDAMDFALAQDWMWDEDDPNELRYQKGQRGPRDYHFYMLLAWVPQLAHLSLELAPERTPDLLALMRRLMKARFIRSDPKAVQAAQAKLAELGGQS